MFSDAPRQQQECSSGFLTSVGLWAERQASWVLQGPVTFKQGDMAALSQASLRGVWMGCQRGAPSQAGASGVTQWLRVLRLHTGSAGFQLSPVSPLQTPPLEAASAGKLWLRRRKKINEKKADTYSETTAHHPPRIAGWACAAGRSPVGIREAREEVEEKQVKRSGTCLWGAAWAASCTAG